jgi:hypothetical protein
MNDAEIRGLLLKLFFDRRENAGGNVPVSDMELSHHGVSRGTIILACQHLGDADLIEWTPMTGVQEGIIVGIGRIAGRGLDVINGLAEAAIAVTLPSSSNPAAEGLTTDHPLYGIHPMRIANWQRHGVDAIEADLLNRGGMTYVGGPPEAREQARRWVRYMRDRDKAKEPEILGLKPGLWGVTVDLKALARWLRSVLKPRHS